MSKNLTKIKVIFLLSSLLAISLIFTSKVKAVDKVTGSYAPKIEPNNFSTVIDNPYFSLPVGKKMMYEAETKEGTERIEIQILPETKTLMGVETRTYWDRVWLNDVLVEETKDYLAQDKQGNVWYFGEVVDNYKDGKLSDHHGSWLAGENGALPGIWFPAKPEVGSSYRQEYYKGEAEDMTEVAAIQQVVTTKNATYKDCVKMYDWTPLDRNSKEYKYYCPGVAALVVSDHLVENTHTELVSSTMENTPPLVPTSTTPKENEHSKKPILVITVLVALLALGLFGKKLFKVS